MGDVILTSFNLSNDGTVTLIKIDPFDARNNYITNQYYNIWLYW
jgi:hypothetical protein